MTDARGCTRKDDIPWFECDALRDVDKQFPDREQHVIRGVELHRLAVEAAFDF